MKKQFAFIAAFLSAVFIILNGFPISVNAFGQKAFADNTVSYGNIPAAYSYATASLPHALAAKRNYGAIILQKRIKAVLGNGGKRKGGALGLKVYVTESIMITSVRGINKYSEVIVPFSQKYQKVKLIYAYTVLGGKYKVPVGKHAVNVVSPRFAVSNPAYSSFKYLTISMPAVEPGSILNFSYEIEDFKPVIKDGIFYTGYLSHTIPVKSASFSMLYPYGTSPGIYLGGINGRRLRSRIIYMKGKRFVDKSLVLKDIPAIKKELNMPSLKNYRKYVAISTYVSWNKLAGNISGLFAQSEKPSRRIASFAASAVKSAGGAKASEKDRAAAIYGKFVKTFRYAGIGYGANGYRPMPAASTFSDGYGDSKSLAALLITMLRSAGIESSPVLATSLKTSDLNANNVSPRQFDSVLVKVDIKGGNEKSADGKHAFYLYPASSSYKAFKIPFELAGRRAVLLSSSGGGAAGFRFIKLPKERSGQNEKLFKFHGSIDKDGNLSGTALMVLKGVYSYSARSSLKNKDRYHKALSASDFLYGFLPGADITKFRYKNLKNINKNAKLEIKFSDDNYGELRGDVLVFHAVVPADNALLRVAAKPARIYPLVIGYPFEHIVESDVKIPNSSVVYYLQPAFKIDNSAAEASSFCKYEKQDAELNCLFKFRSKAPVIPVDEYAEFRKTVTAYTESIKNYFTAISSIYFYQK